MKKQFLLLFLLAFSKLIYASPDDGIHINDELIGYNDNFYYSFQTVNHPSGTYYSRKDSAFLLERELETGKIVNRIFICSRYHRDSTADGDWKTIDTENSEFDYLDYIKSKSIKYLYPSVYKYASYRSLRFEVDYDGLKMKYKREKELIAEFDKLEVFAPWIKHYLDTMEEMKKEFSSFNKKYVTAACTIGDNEYVFFIIKGQMDAEYLQSIFPIKKSELSLKAREIID